MWAAALSELSQLLRSAGADQCPREAFRKADLGADVGRRSEGGNKRVLTATLMANRPAVKRMRKFCSKVTSSGLKANAFHKGVKSSS